MMTGNLSFQIEHHLYPDLPSNRYAEVAPKVQAVFEKYRLSYVSGSLPRQVGSAWKKVVKLALPNDFARQVVRRATSAPAAVAKTALEATPKAMPAREHLAA
jgi:linoleoyl-CoA desaturase